MTTVRGVARVRHYLTTKPQPPRSSTKSKLNADRNFRWIWQHMSQLGCGPWSLFVLVDLRLLSHWEALGWLKNSSKRYANVMLSLLIPFVSMTLEFYYQKQGMMQNLKNDNIWTHANWLGLGSLLSLESLRLPTPTERNQVSITKILSKQLGWASTSSPKV